MDTDFCVLLPGVMAIEAVSDRPLFALLDVALVVAARWLTHRPESPA
jgi:hypothetical protein